MLSFSLPGQLLFTADTERHCIFRGIVPIPSGLPVKNVIVWAVLQHSESSAEPCSAAGEDCRSLGTRCRGGSSEGEVFDFKLCTRLEIYKQKRRNNSPATLASSYFNCYTVGSFLRLCFRLDIQRICTLNFVWHIAGGCAASFKRPSEVSYSMSSNSLFGLRSICPGW